METKTCGKLKSSYVFFVDTERFGECQGGEPQLLRCNFCDSNHKAVPVPEGDLYANLIANTKRGFRVPSTFWDVCWWQLMGWLVSSWVG